MKYYLLLTALLMFFACSKDSEIKPVDINYGQDICAACSMIISEKQYSAQYVLSDGSVKKFDDIGCIIEHLKQTKNEAGKVSAIFVRDYSTNNWINIKNAHFLKSKNISTPMGHGIVAFLNQEDLKNIQTEIEGEYLGNFEQLIDEKK